MSGPSDKGITKPETPTKPERKRAQPGDFERQVDQIRRDITTVRSNLKAAEAALASSSVTTTNPEDEIQPNVEKPQ